MPSTGIAEACALVRRQFLCSTPLSTFCWQGLLDDLSWESLDVLLRNTVDFGLVLEYPVKISYQKAFLKVLINEAEKQTPEEVHDGLYDAYCCLVALGAAERELCYRHFEGRDGKILTLCEASARISEGTTGLATWEASLALSEWSTRNPQIFSGRSVLELGSGVGLAGINVGVRCAPSHLSLTDCHDAVLDALRRNVALNLPARRPEDVRVRKLPWERIDDAACAELGAVDVVIAADVVYDPEVSEILADALARLLAWNGGSAAYLACAERNADTLAGFLAGLGERALRFSQLAVPAQDSFFWPSEVEIKLFRIEAAEQQ